MVTCTPSIDCLRPRLWNDGGILWWYRQNVLVFAPDRAIVANDRLRQE